MTPDPTFLRQDGLDSILTVTSLPENSGRLWKTPSRLGQERLRHVRHQRHWFLSGFLVYPFFDIKASSGTGGALLHKTHSFSRMPLH